ncbi:MAG: NADH-quinone oxidoreductase subunit F, partial [Planctomycetota bacterium]
MKPPLLLVRAADAPPETLAEYRARGGYAALERALTANSPADVLAEVAASGLRGRGGASFPTAKKWQLAAQQPGPEKFVVANGGEHEPGSNKDRLLVEKYPHTVLEGLLLCAFATGAQKGFLYLIEDMAAQIASAERAIAELRTCHLLAANI